MSGVAESFECLAQRGVGPAAEIYARMFAAHPDTARLFQRDADGGIKAHMLYEAIEAALDIENPHGYGANLIGCEVVNHQNLGVTPDIFVSFYATMHAVTKELCGVAWTSSMETGWTDLIARVDAIVTQRLTL